MTTSLLHAGYPQSDLTLSAAPCNEPDTTQGLTERARRLTDTRWAARVPVIQRQLRAMRQTYPS